MVLSVYDYFMLLWYLWQIGVAIVSSITFLISQISLPTIDLSQLDAGSFPEWFSAIGTVGAVIVALYVSIIDRKRRVAQNRREQAEKIGVWKTHRSGAYQLDTIYISNASHMPIFDIVISYGSSYGSEARYVTGDSQQILMIKIPPGLRKIDPSKNPIKKRSRNHLTQGIAISFRDSNGLFWRRDASGVLIETKRHPFEELGIKQPIPPSRWTPFRLESTD